jgi:hypothetical protein
MTVRVSRANFRQALVQPLDDIATLAERRQARLRVGGQHRARAGWLRQAQSFEAPHPADPDFPEGVARCIPLQS